MPQGKISLTKKRGIVLIYWRLTSLFTFRWVLRKHLRDGLLNLLAVFVGLVGKGVGRRSTPEKFLVVGITDINDEGPCIRDVLVDRSHPTAHPQTTHACGSRGPLTL